MELENDIRNWLLNQGKRYVAKYLLAHAEDGVIWGLIDDNGLQTSDTVAPHISPPLCVSSLLQCRLFSEEGELLIWRTDHGWRARLVQDEPNSEVGALDEDYVLWGNGCEGGKDPFTVVVEGVQGLRHAVPISLPQTHFDDKKHPLRITVRHYLEENPNTGQFFIGYSRLVKLFAVKQEGG